MTWYTPAGENAFSPHRPAFVTVEVETMGVGWPRSHGGRGRAIGVPRVFSVLLALNCKQ